MKDKRYLPLPDHILANLEGVGIVWMPATRVDCEGPFKSELTTQQQEQIKKLQWGFRFADARSLSQWFDNFRRDEHPDREIAIYEGLLPIFKGEVAKRHLSRAEQNRLYRALLGATMFRRAAEQIACDPSWQGYPGLADLYAQVHSAGLFVPVRVLHDKTQKQEENKE